MNESYPISTREFVMIAGKEIAKTIPLAGSFISAHEAVFSAIEMNRVKIVLEETFKRLEALEKSQGKVQVIDARGAEILVYACDQARHDLLTPSKAKEYGSVISNFIGGPADLDKVVEVLDNLRKLNASDLKLLYQFRLGGKLLPNRRVDELVGYSPQTSPIGSRAVLRVNITAALPSFKRLEGLGVLYMTETHAGGPIHEVGELSAYLRQVAFLSEAGQRLVAVLPP